eukprot:838804-Rhodomonas_salina.1
MPVGFRCEVCTRSSVGAKPNDRNLFGSTSTLSARTHWRALAQRHDRKRAHDAMKSLAVLVIRDAKSARVRVVQTWRIVSIQAHVLRVCPVVSIHEQLRGGPHPSQERQHCANLFAEESLNGL